MTVPFEQQSYARHAAAFRSHVGGESKVELAELWKETGSVDAWRHDRMYSTLKPLLECDIGAKWLTVGDGRYGKDARYLADRGADVHASDISDVLLREALAAGFISSFSAENAEALSFGDNSFDYAFCKEAYHHFPRPMVALYEMLRVARKGIVLIEPPDRYIDSTLRATALRRLVFSLRRLVSNPQSRHEYEESGNYVFRISRRELEKVALGLNYAAVAFKGVNDAYIPGVEAEALSDGGPLQRRVKSAIKLKDFLCRVGLMEYSLLTAIIFKEPIPVDLGNTLGKCGFTITRLDPNPYA